MTTKQWQLNEEALIAFASQLASILRNKSAVIYLSGDLGAGKTTFARGFLRGLGFTGKVKSPTYTLVEPYEIEGQKIFHFDLYRIVHADELEEMGIRDYFRTPALSLIEWPEKGMGFLPMPDLECQLVQSGANRELTVTPGTALGLEALEKVVA